MGNGISRTYPAGILKTPPKAVRFGKPEVRNMQQDSWETRPLLNTHEVARLEAKIRAAEMQPMEKPKLPQLKPVPKKDISNRRLAVISGVSIATGILCAAVGPLGLILPAAVIGIWLFCKLTKPRPSISNEHKQATIKAVLHLEKLAVKNERSGFTTQARVYRDMAMQYRIRHKV